MHFVVWTIINGLLPNVSRITAFKCVYLLFLSVACRVSVRARVLCTRAYSEACVISSETNTNISTVVTLQARSRDVQG